MDVRSITTQQRIVEGFINLLEIKEFAKCSVNDIVEAAEVSKRTFYTYFNDKHDLINTIESRLIKGLKESLSLDREKLTKLNHIPSADEINELADTAFNNTIDYCNQNKKEFSQLLSSNGDIYFLRKIINLGNREFDLRFPYLFNNNEEVKDNSLTLIFVRNIYVQGIINILVLWGRSSNLVGISDIKRLMGLSQTKSPVELMKLYKIEQGSLKI
ncbi:TetR/AcrR family transcriptional regulator [Limosilactobacillus fastidiosus]|uniref:TetR/AcrR family transcriptional regulator n=1 Tax=Limosilactobacillus fastidiosus TaxID=2759855 RepID=A0A7W3U093_9LACO|nr:TetR/AcrR family transcriptional regulator [Limosilactobacillus fastidiosus]MBB1062708.1 TetR/AcrR family transcriptional regulator [Limosilactobacillus fastidiosus]MBB1086557.1 TetR/AcrR family transcriptional regulator [Limosilactobacillus fastidiosus]MCD7084879.1 TetR/AcrR family transcriptional regulator [Limosilactobacillus fastidiosus]MCD7085300.1 TetR/AcrR family transcriptional regulator [Limosilactobacillus fastidiosus]MCD7115145.1 TetR/AcrR family transcriptional regulator [Limosi